MKKIYGFASPRDPFGLFSREIYSFSWWIRQCIQLIPSQPWIWTTIACSMCSNKCWSISRQALEDRKGSRRREISGFVCGTASQSLWGKLEFRFQTDEMTSVRILVATWSDTIWILSKWCQTCGWIGFNFNLFAACFLHNIIIDRIGYAWATSTCSMLVWLSRCGRRCRTELAIYLYRSFALHSYNIHRKIIIQYEHHASSVYTWTQNVIFGQCRAARMHCIYPFHRQSYTATHTCVHLFICRMSHCEWRWL